MIANLENQMPDLQTLFENETQGDDQDASNAGAGQLLQKLAEDSGVDLASLGQEKVAELMSAFANEPVPTSEDIMNTNELTAADVSVELAKVAAAEGVDLSTLPREEAQEAFDKLAADMQTPEYWDKQQKIAEAHDLGAHIADGFLASIKEAGLSDMAAKGIAAAKGGASAAKGKLKNLGESAAAGARSAGAKANKGAESLGAKITRKSHHVTPGSPVTIATQRKINRGVGYGAAGASAAAVGGGAAMAAKKKEASAEEVEDEALKVAQDFLLENGIDPETGEEKVASHEDVVEARAIEMLQEAGYID